MNAALRRIGSGDDTALIGVSSRLPMRVRNAYEAAAHTRRTFGWNAPTASPNAAVLSNLTTLRDRSRAAVRNDGYAKGAIDKLVSNIVGTGIKPLSQADWPEFRTDLQGLWNRWIEESDADGLLHWYGQQSQAVRCWLEAGEVFLRLRPRLLADGLSVPLQVQVIEPELCPHNYSIQLASGNRVRAGIEFDAIGRRVAYWFHPSRPGDLEDFDSSQLRRVPAEAVIHLYDPLRAGQIRGIPHLTQALVKLFEGDKFQDAVQLRQLLANLFVAFLSRTQASDDSDEHPLTGLVESGYGTDDRPALKLEPGIFQELDPGEKVEFSTPPDAGNGYKDFMRQQLLGVSAATGVPYELLSGDMVGLQDRVVRVILNEFRGRIAAWQHGVIDARLSMPLWRAWMYRVFLSGALQIPAAYLENATPWTRVKWTPPRSPYIHPVQDVEAQRAAIRAGLTSRSAVVSEHGEDAELVDAEQNADNTRADQLGLRYDSDGRQTTSTTARRPERADDPEPTGAAT